MVVVLPQPNSTRRYDGLVVLLVMNYDNLKGEFEYTIRSHVVPQVISPIPSRSSAPSPPLPSFPPGPSAPPCFPFPDSISSESWFGVVCASLGAAGVQGRKTGD